MVTDRPTPISLSYSYFSRLQSNNSDGSQDPQCEFHMDPLKYKFLCLGQTHGIWNSRGIPRNDVFRSLQGGSGAHQGLRNTGLDYPSKHPGTSVFPQAVVHNISSLSQIKCCLSLRWSWEIQEINTVLLFTALVAGAYCPLCVWVYNIITHGLCNISFTRQPFED